MIETLWGTSFTSTGITVTLGANATDLAFNSVYATCNPNAIGNYTWSVMQDTTVTVDADLDDVVLEIRFYGAGSGSTFDIEVYDGTSWTVVATYNATTLPPATATIVAWNVKTILNTVAKINNAQVRVNWTVKKNNDNLYLDEARLIVTSKEKITPITSVTITENVNILIPINYVNRFETIAIAENINEYLNVLYLQAVEPFSVLITEHIDVIDLVVELGVVMDAIYVNGDNAWASLDRLNIVVATSVSINDVAVAGQDKVIDQYESIAVGEYVYASLTTLHIDVAQNISTTENIEPSIDSLNIDVYQQFLITEVAYLVDLVVEVGVLPDDVNIEEWIKGHLDNLFFDVVDSVAVEEVNGQIIDSLFLSVDDSVSAEEQITPLIPISFISVEESVLTEDVGEVLIPELPIGVIEDYITVSETAGQGVDPLLLFAVDEEYIFINETAQILDLIIELGWVVEYNYVIEAIDVNLDRLNIDTSETLTVAELNNVLIGNYFIDVYDEAITEEAVEVSLDELFIARHEIIYAIEWWDEVLTELFFEATDDIGVAEWAGVTDIIIDVGIVDYVNAIESVNVWFPEYAVVAIESVSVNEDLQSFIDNLFIDASDSLTVEEDFESYLGEGFIKISTLVAVSEAIEVRVDPLRILSVSNISVIDWAIMTDIIVEMAGYDSVTIDEAIDVVLDSLNIETTDSISIEEDATVFDIIIELDTPTEDIAVTEDWSISIYSLEINIVVSDSVTADDVMISEQGVSVGEDVGVTGALIDNIKVVENANVLMPLYLIEVFENIAVEEWYDVLDLIVEIPLLWEDLSVEAILLGIEAVVEINVFENLTLEEWNQAGMAIYVSVIELIDVEEWSIVLQQAWDLYPRIFDVVPRRRIWKRYKVGYKIGGER